MLLCESSFFDITRAIFEGVKELIFLSYLRSLQALRVITKWEWNEYIFLSAKRSENIRQKKKKNIIRTTGSDLVSGVKTQCGKCEI